ncbi:cysteine-rich receptor-like protein kinase 44 [Aristolochia californica]|uniref:cysteine-rich receptor-like protein kinase 44 n=1 Tax=Aristolochia californica TaxID=171875 RepID=UPI0035DC8327
MAYGSATFSLVISLISLSISSTISSTIIEDLNQPPPPNFQDTVRKNCLQNPSLRYCNSSLHDLRDIYKSTIVAERLCNESKNPNCTDDFTKIDLGSRPVIAPLYLSFTFFWKYCPLTVRSIDLSNNSLEGPFPLEILNCSQIMSLDLSHNDLHGEAPTEALIHMESLSSLNLSYNHLFSRSNLTQLFARYNSSSFIHSGLSLNGHSDQSVRFRRVILLVLFAVSLITTMVCFGWLCFYRPDYLPVCFMRPNTFTLAMLKAATKGFSSETLVAESGRVEIYRGVLRDGSEVGIELERGKISVETRREFLQECKVLVKMQHSNLIQVLGWCDRRELRAVVTRWIDVDSIQRWLSGAPPWRQRLKVLAGVTEAMCYMQENWPQVGYDLRTSTVLVSESHDPLISRYKIGDNTSSSKRVYRFGVFVLEIVSNKCSREGFERGDAGFLEWVRSHYPGHARKIMDEKLRKTNIAYEPVKQTIGIGLMCAELSINQQPSMERVRRMIKRVYESSMTMTSPTEQRTGSGHWQNQAR